MLRSGGSPDGAKLVIRGRSNWEGSAEMARKLAGINVPVQEPAKQGRNSVTLSTEATTFVIQSFRSYKAGAD